LQSLKQAMPSLIVFVKNKGHSLPRECPDKVLDRLFLSCLNDA